ncbi:MAG TPA: SEC-C metal-binding domain-containing protein [Gammaproteobacteria bacterium]|nr:SEC-C metal-binding domain-containing protein [Gammaproteobacteria bacterium]
MAVGRNEPCTCGSGKKYKHCCALKTQKTSITSRVAMSLIGLMLLGGAIVMLMSLDDLDSERAGPRRVWSEEHQHWH